MPGTTRSTTGLPPGVHLGPTGPRLLAALVEVGPVWLLTAMAVLFVFVLDGRAIIAALFALLAVAWAILVWAQRAAKAAGPGMRLDSLQIVGFHDGRPHRLGSGPAPLAGVRGPDRQRRRPDRDGRRDGSSPAPTGLARPRRRCCGDQGTTARAP